MTETSQPFYFLTSVSQAMLQARRRKGVQGPTTTGFIVNRLGGNQTHVEGLNAPHRLAVDRERFGEKQTSCRCVIGLATYNSPTFTSRVAQGPKNPYLIPDLVVTPRSARDHR